MTKLGSIVGHRIDYNVVGVLRGQRHMPSKTWPKYPPPGNLQCHTRSWRDPFYENLLHLFVYVKDKGANGLTILLLRSVRSWEILKENSAAPSSAKKYHVWEALDWYHASLFDWKNLSLPCFRVDNKDNALAKAPNPPLPPSQNSNCMPLTHVLDVFKHKQ